MKFFHASLAALAIINVTVVWSLCEDCPPCSTVFRCSSIEDPVWATDGVTCYPQLNNCLLASLNCQRQNECQAALTEVCKEQCQQLCRPCCPSIDAPFCAERNGSLRTFPNQCELTSYICRTGEFYRRERDGPCPSLVPS